jgi:methanogenic corrinoid protein MtbC1
MERSVRFVPEGEGPTCADSRASRGGTQSKESVDDAPVAAPAQPSAVPADADVRLARLAQAIEHEIIPRLMMAHRAAPTCPTVSLDGPTLGAGDVEEFTRLVLESNDEAAQACVDTLIARGVAVESIYHDLLAPTARHLGELWNEDLCDFTEVTLGLGRLQRVLRETSAQLAAPAVTGAVREVDRRILLLPSPGEQHTFGLVMVAEFFRRAGWDVAGGPWEAGEDAVALVGDEWYDVVGFSLGHDSHVDRLADCIAAVRQASRNGNVVIMVGGPLVGERPEIAQRVGADLHASDGRHAPGLAERIVCRHGMQN